MKEKFILSLILTTLSLSKFFAATAFNATDKPIKVYAEIYENLLNQTLENDFYRKVLNTAKNSQLVLMNIKPGQEIGEEVHKVDQILFFVQGNSKAVIDGEIKNVSPNDVVIVPAGSKHNFINVGPDELKLFTIYAPAQYPAGTMHKTKEEAEREEKS